MTEQLLAYLADHSHLADWISAGVAVIALIGVSVEYRNQKRRSRLELAQELIQELSVDEMLQFTITTLDWGAAIVIVPDAWRNVEIGKYRLGPSLAWNLEEIRDALTPKLLKVTAEDPKRLLYRHAFVHLFNFLERVGYLVQGNAIDIDDLAPLAWIAHRVTKWEYVPAEQAQFFLPALNAWYGNQVPQKLIANLVLKFPNEK